MKRLELIANQLGANKSKGQDNETFQGFNEDEIKFTLVRSVYKSNIQKASELINSLAESSGENKLYAAALATDYRRQEGKAGKELTNLILPGSIEVIASRNTKAYGDPLGPTMPWLINKHINAEDPGKKIIEASLRTGGDNIVPKNINDKSTELSKLNSDEILKLAKQKVEDKNFTEVFEKYVIQTKELSNQLSSDISSIQNKIKVAEHIENDTRKIKLAIEKKLSPIAAKIGEDIKKDVLQNKNISHTPTIKKHDKDMVAKL